MPAYNQRSDRFLSDIVEMLDVPAIVVNTERKILFLNQSAGRMAGCAAAAAVGRHFGAVMGLDEKSISAQWSAAGESGRAGRSSEGEWICPRRDGAEASFRIRYKALRQGDDEAGMYLLTFEPVEPWEQRYKEVLARMPVVFFEASSDGRLVYGANQLAAALGRPETEVEGGQFLDLVADADRQRVQGLWTQLLDGKAIQGREVRLRAARDAVKPFWFSLFPVTSADGRVVSVRGIATDLGAEKGLAYALESAEERFSVLFRESSDPILILSMGGEILSANPSFERITGIRSDQLFSGGKAWGDFVLEADVPLVQASIRRCAERGEDNCVEFRVRGAGEQPVWYEQSHSILHDELGKAKGIMAVARDIDRRKQQEFVLLERAQDMQRRHQRAQALISKLKGFFTRISSLPTDIDSFINGVCDILFDMYRPFRVAVFVRDKELKLYQVGAHLPASLADGEGNPLLSTMSRNVLDTSLPLYCNDLDEAEPYRDDPVVRELKLKTYLGAPLRDTTGKNRGTLSLVDTETRAFDSLDVELVTVAALHVAARLRAEEQEEVKRELEEHLRQAQKMEAVGMLAGGIAHDFNNILSGILGFSSFLLSKQQEGTDLYRNLELIEQSAVRASELTRQLLAFSRRKHFAKRPVSMNDVVREVLALLQRSLAKNIVIRSELSDDLPPVLGDPGQLNQVMMNLCLNAADAMSDRGGTLRLKTAHRLLTSRERTVLVDSGQGEYVCITVSDTGKGMTDDVQKHIFDPFFTTKSDRGGSGLGLSIVYGIVTNHGGDIAVESAEGKGSVFKLYFPVHRGEVEKKDRPASLPLRGTETILVVDDETIVRQMVTAVLKEYGYKVLAVSSGHEAIETLRELKGRVHLVLLDMVMPGMDGEATYHAVRKVDANLPVLLTSGFADEGRSERLIKAGAKGMIHKPYKSEDLVARIRQVLTEHVWSSA